jgi:hypothetical protein
MGMKRVVVHIDRLVLRGLRHEEQDAIAMALRERLEHTFGSREAVQQLSTLGNVPRLRLNSMPFGPGSKPRSAGANAARNIPRT